jgi:hypothetical protein
MSLKVAFKVSSSLCLISRTLSNKGTSSSQIKYLRGFHMKKSAIRSQITVAQNGAFSTNVRRIYQMVMC